MKQTLCGCCSGIEAITPMAEVNPAGLSALTYRAGDYSTFFETMIARLTGTYIEVPDPSGNNLPTRVYPLRQLTTRQTDDASIALLDAWAIVGDILTFYQERIANEGYLATAIERRSILELARLVGYRLRPGVSASVYLAFTVAAGFEGTIPAGTRAQSIPATGQTAQPFETTYDLAARDTWNNLGIRLTAPQVITPEVNLTAVPTLGTNADVIDSIYFSGTSTNLKPGDALLIVLGDGHEQQTLRMVQAVNPLSPQQTTQVVLQQPLPVPGASVEATLSVVLGRFVTDAASIFPGSALASQAAALVQNVFASGGAYQTISDTLAGVQTLNDIATKRQFTRLQAWLGHLIESLQALPSVLAQVPTAAAAHERVDARSSDGQGYTPTVISPVSQLSQLTALIPSLTVPPSVQPANAFRLARSVNQTFAPQSDIAPRLLSALHPAAADLLYKAWGNTETTGAPVQIYALRVRASLFGSNAPLQIQFTPGTSAISKVQDWPITNEDPTAVYLDSVYNQILPNTWVVVKTAKTNATTEGTIFAKAVNPSVRSRGDYGISAKSTYIELGWPQNSTERQTWITIPANSNITPPNDDFQAIRQTTVYAQAEELQLSESPLDRDVSSGTIELDGLYDGIEPGRWVIVSGERTDIPNVSGVTTSELAMISGVSQGRGKQFCSTAPPAFVPFQFIYYVTGPAENGDLLVVGASSTAVVTLISQLSLPIAAGQQYCDAIEVASNVFANAYVPTANDRAGNFPDFDGLLVDPFNGGAPFPQGQIPASRLGGLLAWRIASLASASETIHTTLALATPLAYTYNTANIDLYGNVAIATNGQSVGEVLGNGDASQTFQTFNLSQGPLTYLSASTPAGAQSTLRVTVNDIQWAEADNLPALGATDRGFITQTDNSSITSITFGNGVEGVRPPTGNSNIKATYRYGIGSGGNVDANQISQLATQPLGVKSVINPLAATGGADADSIDQGRRNIPIAVLALDRLVSVQDYADFARNYAGIAKASSRKVIANSMQYVHVTIAGVGDIPIALSSDLYRNLLLSLKQFGDPLVQVQLALRSGKLLVVSAGVQLLPGYLWESVQPAVTSAVQCYFNFDQRSLGQSAYLSEAISVMQAVAGVAYVNVQVFDSVSSGITSQALAALATTLKAREVVSAQLARPNPDQSNPTQPILPAEVVFMTADIPQTLILSQIPS